MAAQTSPTLTSTSHTLTAAPPSKMAPARSSTTDGEAAASLLLSLRSTNRHTFLRPSAAISNDSLDVVKKTLEGFATQVGEQQEQRLKESRKRKRRGGGDGQHVDVLKLRKVYVDGFETGQVWQQAKRIIAGVLSFSDAVLDELEERRQVALPGGEGVESGSDQEQDDAKVDAGSEEVGDEEEEDETGISVEDLEDELQDQGEDESLGGQGDYDDGEEDENEEESEDEEFVQDAHGLNDGFFSIDNFNRQTQWFEEQDARGDPTTDQAGNDEDIDWGADPFAPQKASKQKPGADNDAPSDDDAENDGDDDDDQGPTFGDMALDAPEGDSEDEAMQDGAGDDGGEFNANEIYYKDFFAPPPKKTKGGKSKPKKSVKFEVQQPAEADVERAMADVRRDLFDDESDEEDSDDALSDVSAGDPRSRRSAHERRQAKLAEEIRQLEAASVAKREWTLSGEAAAADRPMNSLLEEDLDFEHGGKPVPVITPEVSEGIEELIKRRVLAQEFDEVLRRRPDAEGLPAGTRRGMAELDDTKSSKGLAELYEEEHVKKTNPDSHVSQSDEKLAREEKEVEALWKDVCARLDALSSWHYKPKPAAAALSVVADVATVSMEEAQPGTAGESSSRMAPQEVYRAGAAVGAGEAGRAEVSTRGGMPVARAEMSREERTRRRRRNKERARKAGGGAGAAAGGEGAAVRTRRETVAELKKGGVRVINRKGEVTDVDGNKAKAAKSLSGGGLKL
ncbi:M phase phosphoprotein 10 [Hirsutella rhossiliensis]|uniref:U3 small nucleolar ribonucleoprotein protein MPP10 n=1 Tax=Hirsutella rhossiliensis TaxID=111463 RepID=A0A9P8N7N8_9HYPO|nr:mpp10 protein [Hirsutella rhossiliensis]KAH0967481.1 mpp10 protein [Hirsutella rhossiliensis]